MTNETIFCGHLKKTTGSDVHYRQSSVAELHFSNFGKTEPATEISRILVSNGFLGFSAAKKVATTFSLLVFT